MRDATSRLDGFQAVEQNEAPLGIKEKRFLRSYFETQSLPSLLRCYPHSFTFYLGNPFPRFLICR